jgi:leader peptidase (prepilin peptidase)/N-methyltransferase
VFSWLALRGRCRDCHAPIAFRYAAVELLMGALFLACYARFGLTLEGLKYAVFAFLILGLIFTDAETRLLPDVFTLPGLVAGLLFSVSVPVNDIASQFLPGVISLNAQTSWRALSLADAVLGALIGASFIFGSGMVYKLARGVEGMGFGDVKLMAMVGAFLGVKLTVLTIFGASILGSVFGLSMVPLVWVKRTRRRIRRHREPPPLARKRAWDSARKVYRYYAMPFGVFLGSMAILALFFGNALFHWYLNRFAG